MRAPKTGKLIFKVCTQFSVVSRQDIVLPSTGLDMGECEKISKTSLAVVGKMVKQSQYNEDPNVLYVSSFCKI
ncbi:Hypothetical predicted protein, partial [Marmota monax]